MKKLKIALIVIPLLLIVGATFIVVSSYFEHRELVEQEKQEYPAPGVSVDVNDDGSSLHVYAKGEGDHTLIFMSGLGTSSPFYDFKALYDKLSDDHRIAVVERAGYGWSDITSSPRDIDTVMEETRTALSLAGENPPYFLFPHSLSGMEATHWANLYEEEIKAIIGLDPLVPEYYEQTEEPPSLSRVVSLLARTGLMRQQPDVCRNNFQAIEKGHLTEKEIEAACSIFFRRTLTKNMWEEADSVPANSQRVLEEDESDVPFHVFISGEGEEIWKDILSRNAEARGGEYFILDAEHYIHLDEPGFIAEKSREIIGRAEAE